MDIKINAQYSLFLNLKTNLILFLYPKKCIKFNQSESLFRSPKIWNFARHLRFLNRNGRVSLILKNWFLVFLYFIQKRMDYSKEFQKSIDYSKELIVPTLDFRIKQSRLQVFHSKVPSSVNWMNYWVIDILIDWLLFWNDWLIDSLFDWSNIWLIDWFYRVYGW